MAPDDPISAWAPYTPSSQAPWTPALAAHLLRRAGFGATWSQIERAVAEGPQRSVDRLLDPGPEYQRFEEQMALLETNEPAWWVYRILASPWPLVEKMTLFWQNHFAVAASRSSASLTARHIRLLRRHALGRFDQLLTALCHAPALYAALGVQAGKSATHYESFAETLLGQHTLGPGAFTQADVRETARAFSGAVVLREEFRWLDYEHDNGEKTILGRRGNFGIDETLHILLSHPATSRYIVRRMYRWLVSEMDSPPDKLLEPLAESFARDYDIRRLVSTVLRSRHFFSSQAFRRRVKSPVEFAAGICAALEIMPAAGPMHQRIAALGQNLFEPPTREGWIGGRWWLNHFTLTARSNLAVHLLKQANLQGLAAKYGAREVSRFLTALLVQRDATAPVVGVMASEEYQLA